MAFSATSVPVTIKPPQRRGKAKIALCEPVTVRFEVDDGQSWLAQEYHPLTAAVRDYELVAK